jgi:predicted small secreted protein
VTRPVHRLCGVLLAASTLLCGCSTTVGGSAVRAAGAAQADIPPLDEAALDRLLLTVDELDTIMGSTQLEITADLEQMTDHSDEVSDPDCLGAIYAAEEPVYADSGWTAMRDRVAREPGDDNEHWVEQTAVLYATARQAQRFFEASTATWGRCAGDTIVVSNGDYSWSLDDLVVSDSAVPLITQTTKQDGADGWDCQHALAAVSNVIVEAWACAYRIDSEAAEIAEAMVANATR